MMLSRGERKEAVQGDWVLPGNGDPLSLLNEVKSGWGVGQGWGRRIIDILILFISGWTMDMRYDKLCNKRETWWQSSDILVTPTYGPTRWHGDTETRSWLASRKWKYSTHHRDAWWVLLRTGSSNVGSPPGEGSKVSVNITTQILLLHKLIWSILASKIARWFYSFIAHRGKNKWTLNIRLDNGPCV